MKENVPVMEYSGFWMNSSAGTLIFRMQAALPGHQLIPCSQLSLAVHKGPFLGDISCCIPKYTFF